MLEEVEAATKRLVEQLAAENETGSGSGSAGGFEAANEELIRTMIEEDARRL